MALVDDLKQRTPIECSLAIWDASENEEWKMETIQENLWDKRFANGSD
jgi:hypothetical protein